MKSRQKVVFLDRDGTINKDFGYVGTPEKFVFLPGAPEALKALASAGYGLIIVTNQSGIARGFYSEKDMLSVHRHMVQQLKSLGVTFQAIYHCPHHTEGTLPEYTRSCQCRKPATGMLERACKEFEIDLTQSWMVGDKDTDIQAGLAMGVRCALLESDYPGEAGVLSKAMKFPDLHSFAKHVVK